MRFLDGEGLSERLSIELDACDRARNHYRRWHVTAGQDLSGRWHTRVIFGRIGCSGRIIHHDFVTEDAAAAFIRACLRRRATAENRLSIRYRVIAASPSVAAWPGYRRQRSRLLGLHP